MSLIAVAPDHAVYALTPDKYAALVASLKTNQDASDLQIWDNRGVVSYQNIVFAWTYDGSAQLTVVIQQDHNWKAKLAGNEAIFQRLDTDLIEAV